MARLKPKICIECGHERCICEEEAARPLEGVYKELDRRAKPAPGPAEQAIFTTLQVSSCPHYNQCLERAAMAGWPRMSCHRCLVLDEALGRLIAAVDLQD